MKDLLIKKYQLVYLQLQRLLIKCLGWDISDEEKAWVRKKIKEIGKNYLNKMKELNG